MKKCCFYCTILAVFLLCINTIYAAASGEDSSLLEQFYNDFLPESSQRDSIIEKYSNRKLTMDTVTYDFIDKYVPDNAILEYNDYRGSKVASDSLIIRDYPNYIITFELPENEDAKGGTMLVCDFVIPERTYMTDSLKIDAYAGIDDITDAIGEIYVKSKKDSEWEFYSLFYPEIMKSAVLGPTVQVPSYMWNGKYENVKILMAVSMTGDPDSLKLFSLDYVKNRDNLLWLFGKPVVFKWDLFFKIAGTVAVIVIILLIRYFKKKHMQLIAPEMD